MKKMIVLLSLMSNITAFADAGPSLSGSYKLTNEEVKHGNVTCLSEITIVESDCIKVYASDEGKFNPGYEDLSACNINNGSVIANDVVFGDNSRIVTTRESTLIASSLSVVDIVSSFHKNGVLNETTIERTSIKKLSDILVQEFSRYDESGHERGISTCIYKAI